MSVDHHRIENDGYMTPRALTDAIVKKLIGDGFLLPGESVCEPSAGDGSFVASLTEAGLRCHANEIDPKHLPRLRELTPHVHIRDFLDVNLCLSPTIIGNPPYAHAMAHVQHAINLAYLHDKGTVAFLLRLAFLESKKRAAFWREYPCAKVYVLAERPSFIGGGTDAKTAYGLFVWSKARTHRTELEVWSWKPASRDAANATATHAANTG